MASSLRKNSATALDFATASRVNAVAAFFLIYKASSHVAVVNQDV